MDVSDKWGEKMSRLIRYDDAIERLGAHLMANAQIDWGGTASTDIEDWKELADMILNGVPTIDAVSVVRGEWIDEADKYDASFGIHDYRCSNCNSYADEYIGGHEWYTADKPNFCPNCGAKMKGADDE